MVKNREIEELSKRRDQINVVEQQMEILLMVLRKLYKENIRHVYEKATKGQLGGIKGDNLEKFKESMSILQLGAEELRGFIAAKKTGRSG